MLLNMAGMMSLAKILSSCIDANILGCEVIREFKKNSVNKVSGTLKEEGEIRSVVTQADLDAQKIIMNKLRSDLGDQLNIIGEEDLTSIEKSNENIQKDDSKILEQVLNDYNENISLDELTIFVDPLDGTREFVEDRGQNVGCLIGIARNGKAIGGTVGLPFPNGKLDCDPVIYYSLLKEEKDALSGILPQSHSSLTLDESNGSQQEIPSSISVFTGDSSNPVLMNATQTALSLASSILSDRSPSDKPTHKIIGGTAAKLLQVSRTKNSIAVTHFKTCLWDTCATEAIVHAKGGKVTDLFGSPLTHSPNYNPGSNAFGVVASSGEDQMNHLHDKLCEAMRNDWKSVKKIFGKYMGDYYGNDIKVAQAVDIAKDLDGAPLNCSWLEEKLDINDKKSSYSLRGYAVPESNAARGLMSNGCRIMLEWEVNNEKNKSQSTLPPSSVFFKRVVMAESPDSRSKLKNNPHKLIRDVRSYQVETAFLTSDACQRGLIEEAGVLVNKVYASDLRPAAAGTGPNEQILSRFAMLLHDFRIEEGWTQEWLLEKDSSKAALKALAQMHGYFWQGSNFWKKTEWGDVLENAVWPNGGYMQPSLQGLDQLENVAKGWTSRLPTFKEPLLRIDELRGVDLDTIGLRLEKISKIVGEKSHPFSEDSSTALEYEKYRTIIHGDPKQANIFLREKRSHSQSTKKYLEAGLIDFQWCGFGLASTDVAHHICAAVQPACLSYDGSKENDLLDYYYQCLTESLIQHGVASSEKDVQENVFPRTILQEQYEIAVLDICRMVFAYAWKRWKPEDKPSPDSLNRNAYNKSLPSVLWLITRCSKILSVRETHF